LLEQTKVHISRRLIRTHALPQQPALAQIRLMASDRWCCEASGRSRHCSGSPISSGAGDWQKRFSNRAKRAHGHRHASRLLGGPLPSWVVSSIADHACPVSAVIRISLSGSPAPL